MHTEFWLVNLKDRDHLIDVDSSGGVGNIVVDLKEAGCMNVNWIHLIKTSKWQVVLTTLVNLQVS
jgi:hypothetical protein